jgi:CheY-like chemotaxis protein
MSLRRNLKKKKIMVMDDEPEMRFFLSNLLNNHGFEMLDMENPSIAIQAAADSAPDIIVLNAMMMKDIGILIYRSLKQDDRLKQIPVLMLSPLDKTTFFHFHKFRKNPSFQELPEPEAYLKKPVETEQFLELIHNLLQSKKAGEV